MKRSPLYFFIILFFVVLKVHGQIKLGENIENISPYALLELESSTKGFLLPRMTTAQRDVTFDQDTPKGMMIFNLDLNTIQYLIEEIDPLSNPSTGIKVWKNATDQPMVSDSLPQTGTVGDLLFYPPEGEFYYYSAEGWTPLNKDTNSPVELLFEDNRQYPNLC